MVLRKGVERAARFVKHRNRAILRKSSCRQYLLILSAGKHRALLGKLAGKNCLFPQSPAFYLLTYIRQF